jgi:hypothetical protein
VIILINEARGSPKKTNLPLSEAEIKNILHPYQANVGYFHVWFQFFQLPSTQSESSFAPKSHVLFKVCIQL